MDFLRGPLGSALNGVVGLLICLAQGAAVGVLGLAVGRMHPAVYIDPLQTIALTSGFYVVGLFAANSYTGPPVILFRRRREHLATGEYATRLTVAFLLGFVVTIGLHFLRRSVPPQSELGFYLMARDGNDQLAIAMAGAGCAIVTGFLTAVFVRQPSAYRSSGSRSHESVMSGVSESDYESRRREAYRNLGRRHPQQAASRAPAPSERKTPARKIPWIAVAAISMLGIAFLAIGRSLIRQGAADSSVVVKKAQPVSPIQTSEETFEDIPTSRIADLIRETIPQAKTLPEELQGEILGRLACIAYKSGDLNLAIDCISQEPGYRNTYSRVVTATVIAEAEALRGNVSAARDILKRYYISDPPHSAPFSYARAGNKDSALVALIGLPKNEGALSMALGQVYSGDPGGAKQTLLDRRGASEAAAEAWVELLTAYSETPNEVPKALDTASHTIDHLSNSERDKPQLLKVLADLQMTNGRTELALISLDDYMEIRTLDGSKQHEVQNDELLLTGAVLQASKGTISEALRTAGQITRKVPQAEALARIASFQVERGNLQDGRDTLAKAEDLLTSVTAAPLDSDAWSAASTPDHSAFTANWYVVWANYRCGNRDAVKRAVDNAVMSYCRLTTKESRSQALSASDRTGYTKLLARVWHLILASSSQTDAAEVSDTLLDLISANSFHPSNYYPPIVLRPILPPHHRRHELEGP